MHKTNTNTKKLNLNIQSIRLLKTQQLADVVGGSYTTTYKEGGTVGNCNTSATHTCITR